MPFLCLLLHFYLFQNSSKILPGYSLCMLYWHIRRHPHVRRTRSECNCCFRGSKNRSCLGWSWFIFCHLYLPVRKRQIWFQIWGPVSLYFLYLLKILVHFLFFCWISFSMESYLVTYFLKYLLHFKLIFC